MITGVVVTEDFTKGEFNSNFTNYWQVNGLGTGFRPPNNRDFNFALSNRIAAGGGSFSNNLAFSVPDAATTHPSGLQQFRIAKDDEVAVVRYTTFSDIARNSREQFHVQVALLQTDPNLEDSPHFGHDLSIETESRFVSYGAGHPDRLQLTANVENAENITSEQKNAYYDNTMTAADLDREYSNLVIWRDLPGDGLTNIEQWGSNAIGDYNVNAEMANQFDPNIDAEEALFNEVRVFLQRGGTNVSLIRDDVTLEDAQIGLRDLHVGITKKTDFNLDYRTDARDFILWNTYYNFPAPTSTLLTGDADNNNAVDLADFELWKSNKGAIHDANFNLSQSFYTDDAEAAIADAYIIPTTDSLEPLFTYDPATGELAVDTRGEPLVALILHGQTANSVVDLGNNWWTEAVDNSQQWVDLDLTGFSSNELVTIANLDVGLSSTDIGTIEVGFATGGRALVSPAIKIDNESNNTGLIAELNFEDYSGSTINDSSVFGNDNSGTLENGTALQTIDGDLDTVASFDGNNDYIGLANSTDINLGIHTQRTISLWFRADDINISDRKQALYEEGGAARGLNIYLNAGELYVGGWNIPESGWSGTYLATDEISSNAWHHVALVLDGTETVQPDSFIAYIDGQEFARGEGSQLWSHGGAIALGNVWGGTKFHNGSSSDFNHGLQGNLDELQIYNRALTDTEINDIFTATTPPETTINPNEAMIAELQFDGTNGTIAADSSSFGGNNFGQLLNGADFNTATGNNSGVVSFDGNNDYVGLANTTDINIGIHDRRTVSLWFQADDVTLNRSQVLYEEGGSARGLNIYLNAGELYVGGWNTPESGWSGTYLATDEISSNAWHHVALVLDGTETVQSESFIAYIDGQEFARGEGSQLWSHSGGIGLGNIVGSTKFHDGVSKSDSGFAGSIDEVQIYNRFLDDSEITELYTSFNT